jgi:cytochrome c556
MMAESFHVLMANSRCPDATWADETKELREGSEAVLRALDAKDAAGAQKEFQRVAASCKACHTAHKK